MFPNNSLKSISPDVRMMQAFPNIFFLKEIVVGSSHEKETLRKKRLCVVWESFNLT